MTTNSHADTVTAAYRSMLQSKTGGRQAAGTSSIQKSKLSEIKIVRVPVRVRVFSTRSEMSFL